MNLQLIERLDKYLLQYKDDNGNKYADSEIISYDKIKQMLVESVKSIYGTKRKNASYVEFLVSIINGESNVEKLLKLYIKSFIDTTHPDKCLKHKADIELTQYLEEDVAEYFMSVLDRGGNGFWFNEVIFPVVDAFRRYKKLSYDRDTKNWLFNKIDEELRDTGRVFERYVKKNFYTIKKYFINYLMNVYSSMHPWPDDYEEGDNPGEDYTYREVLAGKKSLNPKFYNA